MLGEALHGYFENYASDEGLPAEHWFWDYSRSGGIFIEHGVHFFDLMQGWFGPGDVVAAQATRRPDNGIEEQVQCTVRYGQTLMVNFYHGFHQPDHMDRQELRIVFERGDLTLHGWGPIEAHLHAVADEQQTRQLCELFNSAQLDVLHVFPPTKRKCRGRHQSIDAYQQFNLGYGLGQNKMVRYGELLRAMMADQIAWIHDHSHQRKITEFNGRDSLVVAAMATQLAHQT